ncbi:MAG: HPr family phosphocarrier protein [Acidobacteriota bacterium]|nr:MAG: HPr family phosphocarrier protein [Acidobacteriota bacterium]
MAERTVTIVNSLGFHARAAARFVELANGFRSRIEIARDGERVDGKSILGILTLAAQAGSQLTLIAEGPDADRALEVLERLVADGFGEGR